MSEPQMAHGDGAVTPLERHARIRRMLRTVAAAVWAIAGFVGIGVGIGSWWLERATARAVGAPVIRFLPSAVDDHTIPVESLGAFSRAFEASAVRDLDTFFDRAFSARSAHERAAFLRLLRDAAERGDRFAIRTFASAAREACRSLQLVGGISFDAERIAACANDLRMTVGRSADAERRDRIARLAELVALLDAGIATPYIAAAFCAAAAETEDVPDVLHESFLRFTAAHCGGATPVEVTGD